MNHKAANPILLELG